MRSSCRHVHSMSLSRSVTQSLAQTAILGATTRRTGAKRARQRRGARTSERGPWQQRRADGSGPGALEARGKRGRRRPRGSGSTWSGQARARRPRPGAGHDDPARERARPEEKLRFIARERNHVEQRQMFERLLLLRTPGLGSQSRNAYGKTIWGRPECDAIGRQIRLPSLASMLDLQRDGRFLRWGARAR